jgi:hypothetical protein
MTEIGANFMTQIHKVWDSIPSLGVVEGVIKE